MCELPFHCLARSCHLEVLMVISIDTLLIKQLRKLLNVILAISLFTWQDVWRDNSILENMSSWHLYRCVFDRYRNRMDSTSAIVPRRSECVMLQEPVEQTALPALSHGGRNALCFTLVAILVMLLQPVEQTAPPPLSRGGRPIKPQDLVLHSSVFVQTNMNSQRVGRLHVRIE